MPHTDALEPPGAVTPVILASASPRRRELLERVGIAVEVRPAGVDETALPGEEAVAYARRVAADKARSIAAAAPARWVLAADTVVEIDRVILGKAESAAEARAMLERLAGRTHRVTTAFALCGPAAAPDTPRTRHVTTCVTMREVDAAELDAYVASGEWRGKAGAYAVQGMAAALVTALTGSVTNVIGLPLAEVVEELARAGAARPDYRRGVAS